MHVMIGGIPREVELKLSDCNSILKQFNAWYTLHIMRMKKLHEEKYLPLILAAEGENKNELIKNYQSVVDRDFVNIEIPYTFIVTAIWRILVPRERKRFKNKILPTRTITAKKRLFKEILREEYEPLAHFVGEQLLHMPGYKKKL